MYSIFLKLTSTSPFVHVCKLFWACKHNIKDNYIFVVAHISEVPIYVKHGLHAYKNYCILACMSQFVETICNHDIRANNEKIE